MLDSSAGLSIQKGLVMGAGWTLGNSLDCNDDDVSTFGWWKLWRTS